MRARYYNPEIKRFINQDILIGSIVDSPTMNRYAYVNGNPISLADPFGLSPSLGWDFWGHLGLSVLSLMMFIPTPITFAIGTAAAVANTAWYAADGDYFSAICSSLVVFGGASVFVGTTGAFGSASCNIAHILKTITCAGAVATGAYDLSMVAYENYQRYVIRGEDFHFMTALFDVVRVGLDVLSIKAGVKGLTDSTRICFVAGTLVATAEGHKIIEEIQVGDEVLSQDVKTGEVAVKKVTQIFENETSELVHITVGDEVISSTPEHPFYVAKFGWTSAIKLRAGDVLVLSNGEYVVVEQIQHEILESPIKVYNFEVEDFHTYFVGETGVLVHNDCQKKTYQTYTKTNPETGEVYSGRTSGTGTPEQNIINRDAKHHMNNRGFNSAVLDQSSTNRRSIRGREQLLIEYHGGAKSFGGTSGNAINGISPYNINKKMYVDSAIKEFGNLNKSNMPSMLLTKN